MFHLGLPGPLRHSLRHKANICHVRSRCTASSTRSEHDELSSAMEYNGAGQKTLVLLGKSYYLSMTTLSFKLLEWRPFGFGGRRLNGACDKCHTSLTSSRSCSQLISDFVTLLVSKMRYLFGTGIENQKQPKNCLNQMRVHSDRLFGCSCFWAASGLSNPDPGIEKRPG